MVYIDITMAALRIAIYAMVLVKTIRDKYPAMSPVGTTFVAAWEFASSVMLIYSVITSGFYETIYYGGYVFIVQLIWALLEFAIILTYLLRCKVYSLKWIILYVAWIIAATAFVLFVVFSFEWGQIISYFIGALAAMIAWMIYAFREEFRFDKQCIAIAAFKALVDILGWIYYFKFGLPIVSVLCTILPIADLTYLTGVIIMYRKENTGERTYEKILI